VLVLQPSVVQTFASSQSAPERQQPLTAVFWQAPDAQLSLVHGLPSLHSAATVQQPAMGEYTHCLVFRLQVSLVQERPSLHCVLDVQQPLICAFEQVCAVRLQLSTVHTLVSAHCVSFVQQPETLVLEQV
jgi:hypothetical protein